MNKAAVLGQTGIEKYSLSPLIHSEFFKETSMNGEYSAIAVFPENLENKLNELQDAGFRGVNLTIPHKVNALKYLTYIDKSAKAIGAVNTILFEKNVNRIGYNTDAFGFIEHLNQTIPDWNKNSKVLIFGAGGASRAVIYGLQAQGVQDIIIINRTNESAEKLAKEFGCSFELWENRQNILSSAGLIVNATSAGMCENSPLNINLSGVNSDLIVYDIVYNPLITPLLKQAKDMNLRVVNGLGMLLYQAAKAFEIWFEKYPEINDKIIKKLYEKN